MDMNYFAELYSAARMREIFSEAARFQAWIDTEVALAKAEEVAGLIPVGTAVRLQDAGELANLDLDAMRAEYVRVGFPISPLVHQLARQCDAETARWIHWGATTQDIIDTGLVLQMRDGLGAIEDELNAIIDAQMVLAQTHRDTAMAGRTFQQHAAPITFGYKAAVWLDELLRHRERLTAIKKRILVVQFGGAVGTLSTLGDKGIAVRRELARELGLGEPDISWHTARDGWAELVHWIAMVGASLGKIANEVATLMRSEVDEVREPYAPGRGSSSTMPQKRNPIAAPPIIAIAQRLRECVGSQLSAMIQLHERDVATQPLEWLVIPEAFLLLSGSLKHSRQVVEGMEVDAEQMRHNVVAGGGFLMAEAVMMGLAPKVGRGEAHQLVAAAANRAIDAGQTLREGLLADPHITSHLTEAEIDQLLEPGNYLGCAGEMIDRVLAKAGREPRMDTDERG
jgi:3-carboxy-cis,cis-muconate cycloisomerase